MRRKLLSHIHFYYGRVYKRMNQLNCAEMEYKQGIRANPSHYNCHNSLACLYESQKRIKEARDHFQKALEQSDKKDIIVLYNYATFLQNENKLSESIQYLEKAVHVFSHKFEVIENEKNEIAKKLAKEIKKRMQTEQKIQTLKKELNQIKNENSNLKRRNQTRNDRQRNRCDDELDEIQKLRKENSKLLSRLNRIKVVHGVLNTIADEDIDMLIENKDHEENSDQGSNSRDSDDIDENNEMVQCHSNKRTKSVK